MTLALICAAYIAALVLVLAAVWRWGQWMDGRGRVTRWEREAVHGEHDASAPTRKHGLN